MCRERSSITRNGSQERKNPTGGDTIGAEIRKLRRRSLSTRSAKSIGVDAPAIRIDVPTDAPKPIQTVVKKPQELVLVSEQLLRSVTVRFRWNSAQLDPKEKARLNELASILKDAKRVRVLGRTDGTGTGDANDRLANKRAMSVMLHLRDVVNGTSEDKVQLSSKGLCCYVADNQTKAGRSNNRRAEVEIYGDVEAPGHPNN